MNRLVLAVVLAGVAVGGVLGQAEAGCWCHLEYCIGSGALTVDPSSVVTWTTYDTLATDSKSIGSCPYQGATPPSKTCVANAGTQNVYSWEISGTAEYELFGVSAKYGSSLSINANCGGPVVINSWCSCCQARARLKYNMTYKCGDCWCFSPLCITSSTYCGTNKVYDSLVCDDKPTCSPPSPCDPNCPE